MLAALVTKFRRDMFTIILASVLDTVSFLWGAAGFESTSPQRVLVDRFFCVQILAQSPLNMASIEVSSDSAEFFRSATELLGA
jgi:hypothetical protein